jgi:hypothetical protein
VPGRARRKLTSAQEADERQFFHAGLARGLNYIARALHVDALEGLFAQLTIDTRAVGDSVAARNRAPHGFCVRHVAAVAAREFHRLMAVCRQQFR